MDKPRQLIVLGSAHRVGSGWLFDLLRSFSRCETLAFPDSWIRTRPARLELTDAIRYYRSVGGSFVYKTHACPPPSHFLRKLGPDVKFVTMVRAPRDVVVSMADVLACLHAAEGGWGDEVQRLSTKEKVLRVIEWSSFVPPLLRLWAVFPHAHSVRYEDLVSDGITQLTQVLDFLELKISRNEVEKTHAAHSFERKKTRDTGGALLRKGVSGDWRSHFDDEITTAFVTTRDGAWNKALVQLGYEAEGWHLSRRQQEYR